MKKIQFRYFVAKYSSAELTRQRLSIYSRFQHLGRRTAVDYTDDQMNDLKEFTRPIIGVDFTDARVKLESSTGKSWRRFNLVEIERPVEVFTDCNHLDLSDW